MVHHCVEAIKGIFDFRDDDGNIFSIEDRCYIIPKKIIPPGLYYVRDLGVGDCSIGIYEVSDKDLQDYFYINLGSNLGFLEKMAFGKEIFNRDCELKGQASAGKERKQLTDTERNFLYNFIKHIAPSRILEFSCGTGSSTVAISKALQDIKILPEYYETHDIQEECIKITKQTLIDNGIKFVTCKLGDVFNTMDREKLKTTDFLFVDSDHGGEFAERYTREFFPLLKKGCWVGVHDIRFHKDYVTRETEFVVNYLKSNNITSYFHLADLLKMRGMACMYDPFEHCCRNTLFFFRV